MFWLTWRQHRAQVLVTAAFLVALGTFLLVHGLGTADVAAGVAADRLEGALDGRFAAVYTYLSWLPVVPLLAGMFWGAPLIAREAEAGTLRLAWTQSVTRARWLGVKFGVLGLAVTAAGLAVGAMVGAWLDTFDGTRFADRFGDPAFFAATGTAGGAWWLFAFALGAAAGGLFRRTLVAFAVTIAVFLAVMFVLFTNRSEYAEPLSRVVDEPLADGSYVTDSGYLAPDGKVVPTPPQCADKPRDAYMTCVQDSGYPSVQYYQPADRYWRFQLTETGILLLGTVLLAGPVIYRIARRPV